jgi:hypothetical protein
MASTPQRHTQVHWALIPQLQTATTHIFVRLPFFFWGPGKQKVHMDARIHGQKKLSNISAKKKATDTHAQMHMSLSFTHVSGHKKQVQVKLQQVA